jgi:hypothetical protein
MGGGTDTSYADLVAYALTKKQRLCAVVSDAASGRARIGLVQQRTKPLGDFEIIYVSPTAADYTSTVARVKNANCTHVLFLVAANQVSQYIAAAKRGGVNTKFYGGQFMPAKEAANIPGGLKINNDFTIAQELPSPYQTGNKVLAQFRKELAAQRKTGDSLATLPNMFIYPQKCWLSIYAVEKLVESKKIKTIDAPTLMRELSAVKNLDLGGVIPAWTPSKTSVIAGQSRVNSTYGYLISSKNGKTYNTLVKPFNLKQALQGRFPKNAKAPK